MKSTVLNPYLITWAILTPIKGKVTKKDLYQMNAVNIFSKVNNEAIGHFSTPERAKSFINDIVSLSKSYEVVLITDKQFGLCNIKQPIRMSATKKQLQNRFFI